MSGEMEVKEAARRQAMAVSLSRTVKAHPKKTMALGFGLCLIGAVLEFSDPLCSMIPNQLGSIICKGAAKVGKHVLETVDEQGNTAEVTVESGPVVVEDSLGDENREGGATTLPPP